MHVTFVGGRSWILSVREQRVRYEGTTATCRYEASNRFVESIPSLYEPWIGERTPNLTVYIQMTGRCCTVCN